jgi:NitT/TauT family transport system substrate-binding protein
LLKQLLVTENAPRRTFSRARVCASIAGAFLVTGLSRTAEVTAQLPQTIRVATTSSDSYAEVYYAVEKGFFQRAGLSVEVETFANGAAASAALASGSIDIGVSSVLQIAQAFARGIPFVLIAAGALNTEAEPGVMLCVAGASTLRTAQDLDGKIVAVNALKTASEEALDAWLGQNGIAPSRVRTIELPFSEMAAALARGAVDAAVIAEPALTAALRNGAKIVASPTLAIGRQYLISAWFSTRAFAQRNPDAIRRFGAAIYETARWANGHRADSAVILAKHAKLEVDVTSAMRRVRYADALRESDIQNQLDVAVKYNIISRAVSARDILR